MLDSAQKTLIDIALVSQQVVNSLLKHDGCKTVESFRLDKIVVSSGAALVTLNKALSLKECMVDDRLADWLDSEEPQICLSTLKQMDVLLKANPNNGGMNKLFRASRTRSVSGPVKDRSSEAIRLFQKREDCFHFLLTTDIWLVCPRDCNGRVFDNFSRNCENGAQQQLQAISPANVLHVGEALNTLGLEITQRAQETGISRKEAIDCTH